MKTSLLARCLFHIRSLYRTRLSTNGREHTQELESLIYGELKARGQNPGPDENSARVLCVDLEQEERQLSLALGDKP